MSEIFARWAVKFLRRITALGPGRYLIVLTVDGERRDWSVIRLGKVERAQ